MNGWPAARSGSSSGGVVTSTTRRRAGDCSTPRACSAAATRWCATPVARCCRRRDGCEPTRRSSSACATAPSAAGPNRWTSMAEKNPKKKSDISYADASAELERILHEIESGEIDLDVLTEKVERAAALLSVCKDKLAATELKVKQVVADLADDGADGGTDADRET